MDTHPHHPDDLKELERRLSAWEPATTGLDADAMLFAAGRASVRPRPTRFVWPALTACAALLAAVLGVWLAAERAERLALVQQLQRQSLMLAATPAPSPSAMPTPAEGRAEEEPPPDSYLASHRALDKGLDAWPLSAVVRAEPPSPMPSSPSILQVRPLGALLDP